MSNIYNWYKLANKLYQWKIPLISKFIKLLMRIMFSCVIPYTSKIGKNTRFGYAGLGIVIHGNCEIGEGCVISQNVTLGGTNHKPEVPKIGDNVYIGAGAKILGPVKIGDNVVIGANAVVVRDVPSNTLVVGIPAKVIKENIKVEDYV